MKLPLMQKAAVIRFLKLFTLAAFLIVSFALEADAQRDRNRNRDRDNRNRTEDYFDESGVGGFRFWYGGGVGLNFGSSFNTSQFIFSLSPMVGYKITPEFSVGPRVELSYSHIRVGGGNNVSRFNFFDYGVGVFSRYKLFSQFFAHAEYQVENRKFIEGTREFRESRNNFFLGAGYTSGGQIGYEVAILWNLIDNGDTINLPIDYRIAFTYNF